MAVPPYDRALAERVVELVARRVLPPAPLCDEDDVRQEAWLRVTRLWTDEAYGETTVAFDRWLFVRTLCDTRDAFKTEYRRSGSKRRVIGAANLSRGDGWRGSFMPKGGPRERRRGVSLGDETNAPANDYSAFQVPRRSDDKSEQMDLRIDVQEALDRLPHDERFVTRRVYLEGATQAEVAEELGMSQPAVNKILVRSREYLKGML